jgi:GNAT superfamily N-acetyltransferase
MSPSLTVRRIAAEQGAVFRELRTASLREAPYAFGATLEDALSADAASFDATAANHAVSASIATFILYTEGHPAGLIEAHFEDTAARRAFVGELWVAPAVRHLRGGELLVDTAGSWLASEGATEIYAWVADANRNAMRFYQALAFNQSGETRRVTRAPEQVESLLVRHLPGSSQESQK